MDELVKRLMELSEPRQDKCDGCPLEEEYPDCTGCICKTTKAAAEAIEELQATLCNWCAVCPEDKRDLSTCEIYESCRAKPQKEENEDEKSKT